MADLDAAGAVAGVAVAAAGLVGALAAFGASAGFSDVLNPELDVSGPFDLRSAVAGSCQVVGHLASLWAAEAVSGGRSVATGRTSGPADLLVGSAHGLSAIAAVEATGAWALGCESWGVSYVGGRLVNSMGSGAARSSGAGAGVARLSGAWRIAGVSWAYSRVSGRVDKL